jgi:hypothetical protein
MCGSTTLLAHFHALKGTEPFKLALDNRLEELSHLTGLTPENVDFITKSARLAEGSSMWAALFLRT